MILFPSDWDINIAGIEISPSWPSSAKNISSTFSSLSFIIIAT